MSPKSWNVGSSQGIMVLDRKQSRLKKAVVWINLPIIVCYKNILEKLSKVSDLILHFNILMLKNYLLGFTGSLLIY